MKNYLIYILIFSFLSISCSEDIKSNNFIGVSDTGLSDNYQTIDINDQDVNTDGYLDILKDEGVEIIEDVISDDTILSDDFIDVDLLDTSLNDINENPDIVLSDVDGYDVTDINMQDAISDEGNKDSGFDAGEQDVISEDVGLIDFGTKRGLLFSAREKNKTKPSIFYVDPEGGVPQKISPELDEEFTRPFWSPDGNSFYFESSGRIYKTPFGKFEPIEICSGMDFAVSLDERLIVLNKYVKISDMGEYDYELFVFDQDSKSYTQITTFMDGEMENRPSSPSFSPDSKKILFSILNPSGSYDIYSSDLFIYDLSTGFLVNVTNEAKKIQAKVANRSCEWASDINKYAYLHILYPESGYYLVDGLNLPERISSETHNGIDGIAFSPNSNAVAIISDLGKGIKVIDLTGKILYELLIIDLEYIDNLSWK